MERDARQLLIAACVLVVAPALVGCGGDDAGSHGDTAETETAADTAYFTEGTAACAEATGALLEIAPELSPFFDENRFPPGAVEPYGAPAAQQAEILEGLAAELSELEPPDDRDLIADLLVDYLESEATGLRDIQHAAEAGTELDPRVSTNLSVTHYQRVGIAESVGLDACAERVWR